jgi:hypothetical protein
MHPVGSHHTDISRCTVSKTLNTLGVFKNTALRRGLEPKKAEVRGDWTEESITTYFFTQYC